MILEGAGVCPLVKIGDIVNGRTVVALVADRGVRGACKAFKSVAIVVFKKELQVGDYVHPANTSLVNCNECPVLIEDTKHRSNRFELIDLSEEEA